MQWHIKCTWIEDSFWNISARTDAGVKPSCVVRHKSLSEGLLELAKGIESVSDTRERDVEDGSEG